MNARLAAPLEGDAVSPGGTTVAWDAPEEATAEAYRIGIGSSPGATDVFPPDATGDASAFSQDSDFAIFSNETRSTTVSGLPRDGRELFLTLGTMRRGVWNDEFHVIPGPEAVTAGLDSPTPLETIKPRQTFVINPSLAARNYRLTVGTSPGNGDLFDSGTIPAESLAPVDMVVSDGFSRFSTVFVNVELRRRGISGNGNLRIPRASRSSDHRTRPGEKPRFPHPGHHLGTGPLGTKLPTVDRLRDDSRALP